MSPGFGLYLHWPFCRAKCPYCDFNSHVVPAVDQARWRRALLAELDAWAGRIPPRPLGSVFLGGGTPSLMPPETVAAALEAAHARFGLERDCEITLEANPTSVEAGRLRAFGEAGVNRVSLGVQALDDRALRFLGREHDAREALVAVALAARTFERYSFDLIYARPGQTPAAWRRELSAAVGHSGGHLSVYQLTIEPGTRFHALARAGALRTVAADRQAALYEVTQEVLETAGLPAYEISNHARPGEESRHNLLYWRSGDWLAVGPGAHGRVTLDGVRQATANIRAPAAWLAAVERIGHGQAESRALGPDERVAELLLMGLRLAEGVPLARIEREAGRPLEAVLAPGSLERLADHVGVVDGRLVATRSGRLLLDSVIAALLP
jgi:putative oxygen-independent coproporphyrinogen III oxidase